MSEKDISVNQVRDVIDVLLPEGHPTLSMVAGQFGISPRTLQRRLADENMTHSQLIHQIRVVKACQLLTKPDIRIGYIARKTGFATPSAFSRAFQAWTGTSPRAFRNGL